MEVVSEQPLEAYLQENIFTPLGMDSSRLLSAGGEGQAPPYERVSSVLIHSNVPLPQYVMKELAAAAYLRQRLTWRNL